METCEKFLDSPATRALGSRFKLTETHLWDDGCSSDYRQVSSYPKHIRFKYDDDDDDEDVKVDFEGKVSSNTSVKTSGSIVMEDADLFQEMSVLGLPLSFQTSKQSYTQTKGRPKAAQHKDQDSQCRLEDLVLVSPRLSDESQSYLKCRNKTINSSSLISLDQAELSCSGSDLTDDTVELSSSNDGNMVDETGNGNLEEHKCEEQPRNFSNEALVDDLFRTDFQMENAATSNFLERGTSRECYIPDDCVEEHPVELDRNLMELIDTKGSGLGNPMQLDDLDSTISMAKTQVSGMLIESVNVLDCVSDENVGSSAVCGEWSTFWDSFYMRYYFYNFKTQESTWYPPPGMESFAYGDLSNVLDVSKTGVDESKTEVNADPTNSHLEEQLDRHGLADKAGYDEQIGDKVASAQELTGEDLSGSAVDSDIPCALSICDQHMLHGTCQDEINMNLSLSTVNHNQHLENESDQEDSGGLCTRFPLKDFASFGNPFGNDNDNFSANIVARVSDASSLSSTFEAVCDDDLVNCVHMEELETSTKICEQDTSGSFKQKKKRKNRRRKKPLNKNGNYKFEPVDEYNVDVTKYWYQRYLLFSKFDDGIRLDEEGWFSVTPEAIAKHHASRSDGGVVIDCFSGVGGNAIQFAKTNKHVIAIEIDPKKIDYACCNAAIYEVEDRIDFINEDCFSLAPKLKADTVFLSPPWGGPDYLKTTSYDLSMLQPHDGQFLFNTFQVTASLVIMFLPRNVDIVQLAELCLSAGSRWSLEVEKNFLNGKLKAITAYFRKSD